MKGIGEYLLKRETIKEKSYWSYIVGKFADRYNLDCDPKYRISYSRMATKLSLLAKANDPLWLEWFYEDCKKRSNFGKYFNWAINPKNSVSYAKDNISMLKSSQ